MESTPEFGRTFVCACSGLRCNNIVMLLRAAWLGAKRKNE